MSNETNKLKELSQGHQSKWLNNAEKRAFTNGLAEAKFGEVKDMYGKGLRIGYARGIENAMLTPEDIQKLDVMIQAKRKGVTGMFTAKIFTPEQYTEILGKFNEMKFPSIKNEEK